MQDFQYELLSPYDEVGETTTETPVTLYPEDWTFLSHLDNADPTTWDDFRTDTNSLALLNDLSDD
eukprot:3742024-Rhodomonas_salina.1